MKGTYILVIQLEKDQKIKIGSLGTLDFKKGFYYYIGSAMGEKGSSSLINRVMRHLKSEKKIHWHVDYILDNQYSTIIQLYLIPLRFRFECLLAKQIINGSDDFIQNFGSSDCTCKSHLAYYQEFHTLNEILD
ncbi:MAG: GIY-YIG nuclease family protein [Promethearchaeota archaeon]